MNLGHFSLAASLSERGRSRSLRLAAKRRHHKRFSRFLVVLQPRLAVGDIAEELHHRKLHAQAQPQR
jgi:hypothetical protein